MLLVDQVVKSFGHVRAVRGVSFEIPRGQVVGLLGPNGAGKTTTIRMITGFTPPDAGRVVIDGHDMTSSAAEARRRIGYLPESAPLYPEMPVREYLAFRAKLYGLGRAARRDAIDRWVQRCWLRDVAHRRIGHLSKGFKQRVGLAGALLHDPQVLVLDEPTNGLDPTQVAEARSLIRELGKDRTLLISSHVLAEIERLCDRVIVLAAGTLRADGTPADLVRHARVAPAYIVEIKNGPGNPPARVEAMLKQIRGVASVAAAPHPDPAPEPWLRVTVTPESAAADLREPLAEAARNGGLLVRTLYRETPSLERIFIDLIERADTDPGAPRPGARP